MRHLLPCLCLLAACAPEVLPSTSTSAEVPAHAAGGDLVVAPGLGGEWDDPTVADLHGLVITTTIQEAIDLAQPGDVISVQSGAFNEDLVMREGIDVVGAGAGETILNGTVLFNTLGGITRLSRLTVTNPGPIFTDAGIYVVAANAQITDVEVTWFDFGILMDDADNSLVAACEMRLNNYGLWADLTDNLDVYNNLFRSNNIAGVTNYTGSGQVIFNTFVANAFAASSQLGFGGALQFGDFDTEVVKNNLVVGNFFGINCQDDCANDFSNNLVWGNNTNYANEANAQGDDINIDPQFADPANFDFRLSVASPAVDSANGTVNVPVDFQGDPRPSGLSSDIGFDEYVQSDVSLLITEVLANATVETVLEMVELYNAGTTTVNLAGLVLTDGDDIDVLQAFGGSGTLLDPGEYAVIVDPDYDGSYNIPAGVTVLTTGDTNIGNGLTTTDDVTLYESNGSTTIATFSFPKDPGDGVSLEMINLDQGDVNGNWRASACPEGRSPGTAPCFPPSGDPAGLLVTEVMLNGLTDNTDEFVELYNPTDLEIDAAGLFISDGDATDPLQGFANSSTLIPPGGYALILDAGYTYNGYDLPNGITLLTTDDQSIGGSGLSQSDPVSLIAADGSTVIDGFSFPARGPAGVSFERIDYNVADVASNWAAGTDACARGRTPGRLNGNAGGLCEQLLINEVMSNPFNEDRGEYIELYNPGLTPVELAGIQLTDGIQTDTLAPFQGGTTVVGPLSYAVIVDAEYNGSYNIPAGITVVATEDTSLGNGLSIRDEIRLWDGDHLIDLYGFPFNAGNGRAVERIRSRATDSRDNWVASPCPTGASPGTDNCAVGGTTGGSGTSLVEVVLTEIMANALDEDLMEYVEIYNYGTTPVDLALFVFWDGDQLDTVQDWFGGTDTVLMPGDYGLILDFEYDLLADPYDLLAAPTLLLTTSDTSLGSGIATSDDIFLYEPDGATLVDSFTSPSNPGNGVSIEKIDLLGGDVASNWRPTDCGTTETAGLPNCP